MFLVDAHNIQKQPPKVFHNIRLEISQNSQENTCARVSFFNKVGSLWLATLLKKRLWHRCFPVNFAKFLRKPFLQNTSGRRVLNIFEELAKKRA